MVFVRSLACLKRLGLVECVTKTAVIRPILALTPRRVCSDEAKLSHEEGIKAILITYLSLILPVVALFIQQGVLHTPHVIAACKAIDPALFANDFWELEEVEELEQEGDEIEYVDEISEKQERSEVGVQAMVAYMIALELLSPRVVPGAKVLDIASGSGLIAAHFSHMVGPNGLVVAVDSSHAACRFARGRLAQLPFTRSNLRVFENNAYFGFPDAAPFDAIHVGACVKGAFSPYPFTALTA